MKILRLLNNKKIIILLAIFLLNSNSIAEDQPIDIWNTDKKKVEENQLFNDYASVIFDQAILAEGGQLDDPIGYVNKINKFISR